MVLPSNTASFEEFDLLIPLFPSGHVCEITRAPQNGKVKFSALGLSQ
jgi:hypothetical protein